MKARFLTEQKPVKVVETNEYYYIFICINGKEKSEYCSSTTLEEGEGKKEITSEQDYIEYDYTELIIEKENPEYDIEDIKAHPENYIDINDSLNILKRKRVSESKEILKNYLSSHPLFSKVKYKDGRYYTVTEEKQRLLTSKISMYNIYKQQSLEYAILWNDTGNISEEWTIEELTKLSMEIDDYVTPLVSKQQEYEVTIKESTNENEVNSIVLIYE